MTLAEALKKKMGSDYSVRYRFARDTAERIHKEEADGSARRKERGK